MDYGYIRVSTMGQNRAEVPEDFAVIVQEWKKDCITMEEALQKSQISKSTFYRRVKIF